MYVARTPYAHTPTETPTGVAVRLAEQSITRLTDAILTVGAEQPTDPCDRAVRALRLEQLHTRQARWWDVLVRVSDPRTLPFVYIHAAIRARGKAQDEARFWRDTAADWTARALQQPTSDAAGAMSNWDDLAVTEQGRAYLAQAAPVIGAGR